MKRKILRVKRSEAVIELPSLSQVIRIPSEIFRRMARKGVRIIIKVKR